MSSQTRPMTLARHRFRDDAWAVVLLWAGLLAFVLILVLTVAVFRDIRISGWDVASQLPRWFSGGIGVYLAAVYLPLYVAHGYTRREVARQLPLATAGTMLLLAALMTLGYALERGVYALGGWPQELTQSHLFVSPTQYGVVFLEFVLLFAVWTAAGTLAGAAFYRDPGLGLLVAPAVLVMVGLTEALLNPGFLGLISGLVELLGLELEGVSIGAAVVASGIATAVGLLLAWLLVRNMPLRSQRA